LLQNNSNFPIAHLDGAFFRIRNKKYNSALRHYFCFANLNPHPSIILDAISFLSRELDKNSNELGYLFAIGFLKRLLNKENPQLTKAGESNYAQDFSTFIKRADKIKYKEMIEVATKYLARIHSNV